MIARLWSAQTTAARTTAYVDHLKNQVLPAVRELDGYVGALLLERAVPDGVEVLVLTFWRSLDAVRGFAGDELGRAVVADEAAALLTRFDREVRHYEVAVRDDVNTDVGGPR
jgi:heme-degrading monooxygenase HmoA